ncbi:MAG: hypothetical protein ACUVX9_15265 [Anaerolineae bacterium]
MARQPFEPLNQGLLLAFLATSVGLIAHIWVESLTVPPTHGVVVARLSAPTPAGTVTPRPPTPAGLRPTTTPTATWEDLYEFER